jgi:secreted PhoX family phosphatase
MKTRNWVVVLIALLVVIASFATVAPSTQAQDGTGQIFPVTLDNPAAPFIETQAFAMSKGATAEWRKMEGVAIDEINHYLYIAMSEINKGMSDGEGSINATENNCGIVYQAALDADYNITNLLPLIVGGPYDEANSANPCNVDAMANPDGLDVDARGRVWIGEDTGNHENNALFVYDPADGSSKRFATVPVGAEVTGLRIAADGTIFFNVQHPDPMAMYPYNRGVVGVVVGLTANDDFESVAVPEGDAKLTVQVPAGATYQMLGRTGEAIPKEPYYRGFGEVVRVDGSTQFFCNDPDGNMWLPITANEGYLYSNFECRPGAVSKIYIRRNAEGAWDVLEGEMVDFSGVNGTWNNCNASVTPWNTGLTSEEYPDESADLWAAGSSSGAMNDYLGAPANAYDYGYIVELIPGEGVGTNVIKHYVMGRFSMEMTLVMPDGKTAYYGDDGTNRILYKFVAAEAGDLSAGTLYAAKATQVDGEAFNLEWIELGTSDDVTIYDAIRALDPAFVQ